jgi:hypothetical protein
MSTSRERNDRRGVRRHRAAAVDGGAFSAEPAPLPRFLPALLLLFVASGAAALVYEIVWFQLLQLVIGSSAVSLGILLGTFMGGMCAGSLLLPRFVPPRHHPLRVYASIELCIGAIGLLVLWLMPLVGRVYLCVGWRRTARSSRARRRCGPVPAAADVLDGRDAARRRALDRRLVRRNVLARVPLRRQHRRRRLRMPARRVLPVARVRHRGSRPMQPSR